MTKRVMNYLIGEFKKTEGIDLSKDQTAMFKESKKRQKRPKKELSSSMTVQINLPFIAVGNDGPKHMDITLTRSKFEELTSDLIDQTAGPVHQALSDAGISTNELHMVLLVGGSTRMPAVSEKVRQLTGKEPSKNMNPDECVALGAAIRVERLLGKQG